MEGAGTGVNLPVALMYSPSVHPIVSIVSYFSVKQNTDQLDNLLGVKCCTIKHG